MITYDGPPLFEEMTKHSSHLWVLLGDADGVIRGVPIYEDVAYRELVIRGFLVPTITITKDGQWEYRPSRAEAEWRADLELDRRRGAHAMECRIAKPLGEFSPRRRQTLEYTDILAMFGELAA